MRSIGELVDLGLSDPNVLIFGDASILVLNPTPSIDDRVLPNDRVDSVETRRLFGVRLDSGVADRFIRLLRFSPEPTPRSFYCINFPRRWFASNSLHQSITHDDIFNSTPLRTSYAMLAGSRVR